MRLFIAITLALSTTLAAWAAPAVPATPDEISSRMQAGIDAANAKLGFILAAPDDRRNFTNTVAAIDQVLGTFDADTSMVQFMAYTHPDVAMRDAARNAEQAWNNWMVDLGKNEGLCEALETVNKSAKDLTAEHARLLKHMLRDYRRSGMALTAEQRDTLADLESGHIRLGHVHTHAE